MFWNKKIKDIEREKVRRLLKKTIKKGKIFLTIKSMRGKDVTGYNVYVHLGKNIYEIEGYSPYWSTIYLCYRPGKSVLDKPVSIIESIMTELKVGSGTNISIAVI